MAYYNQDPNSQQYYPGYGGSYQQPQYHPGYSQNGYPPPAGPPPVAGGPSYYPPPPGPPQGYGSPAPPQGGYAPPPGPPAGYGAPNSGYNPQYYQPPPPASGGYAPPPGPPVHAHGHQQQQQQYPPPHAGDALYYLGTPIPDPLTPPSSFVLYGYDAAHPAEAIRKATKGFGTNDSMLIGTLVPLTALQMAAVRTKFQASYGKDLVNELESESSGYFKEGLRALSLGPLGYDVYLLDQAMDGPGTKEKLLTELLMGRSNADLRHLITAYNRYKGRDALLGKVKGELSAKTERLFVMALTATGEDDRVPVDHHRVTKDVERLYKGGEKKVGTDEIAFCEILSNRSYTHITALTREYQAKHKKTLQKVIKSEFSGHMRDALLYIVRGASHKRIEHGPGVWRDMKMIEEAMKGLGTKDMQLVWRLTRAHWERPRMEAIRRCYQMRYKKDLEVRVGGETSGSYGKLMKGVVRGH